MGHIKVDRRTFADLGQSWIGDHDVGQCAQRQSLRDCEAPRPDQLARMRPHDCSAKNPALPIGQDLDVSVRLPLRLCAVVVVIWSPEDVKLTAAGPGLRFGQPGLRQFGIGEDDMRNGLGVDADRLTEQRVSDDKSGLIVCGMGEPRLARGDVADRINAGVARF